jgi:arginine/ornithine N-succinyltransferase beta subunit
MTRDQLPAPKSCSRDGCDRKVVARGLCHSHYEAWHQRLPKLLGTTNSHDAILKAMPGSAKQIAAKVGLTSEGARRAINKLHAAGKAHIEDILPPGEASKGRYVWVFAAGPGIDAKLTPRQRRENKRENRRVYERTKKLKPKAETALLYADVFNLTGRRPDFVDQL